MASLDDDLIRDFLSSGTRTGVPGELLVRLRPTKVTAAFDLAD